MGADGPATADAPKGTALSTTLSVIANLVGAGLLSLSFSLKSTGLIPGVVTMMLMCGLNAFTMLLISASCDLAGAYSYKELVLRTWRSSLFGLAVSAIMAFYTMGSAISFLVLLGDFFPSLICMNGCSPGSVGAFFARREVCLSLAGGILLLPLAAQRNLSALRFTSSASFVCIIYTSLMVTARAAMGPLAPQSSISMVSKGTGLFAAFPIFAVAFSLHYNVPRFYFELQDRTFRKFAGVTAGSFSLVLVIYLAIGISGYLLFGSATQGDILQNFGSTDAAAVVARVALTAILLSCYPLAFNSLRSSVAALLPDSWAEQLKAPAERKGRGGGGSSSSFKLEDGHHQQPLLAGAGADVAEEGHSSGSVNGSRVSVPPPVRESSLSGISLSAAQEEGQLGRQGPKKGLLLRLFHALLEDWAHFFLTAFLVGVSVLVAILVPEISVVLEYKGSVAGSFIIYAIPGWLYFSLKRQKLQKEQQERQQLAAGGAMTGGGASGQVGFLSQLLGTKHGWTTILLTLWAGTVLILGTLKASNAL